MPGQNRTTATARGESGIPLILKRMNFMKISYSFISQITGLSDLKI